MTLEQRAVPEIPGLEVVYCRIEGPKGVVKAVVLHDQNQVILVDAGASERDGHRIINAVEGLGFKPEQVSRIVITHSHPDHVGGLRAITDWAHCDVVAHEADAARIESVSGVTVTQKISQEITWTLGGDDIVVFPCPGHTPGSLALYDKRNNTLIAGDALFSAGEWIVLPPPFLTENMDDARQSIESVIARQWPVANIVVGHGENVYGWGTESLGYSVLLKRPW